MSYKFFCFLFLFYGCLLYANPVEKTVKIVDGKDLSKINLHRSSVSFLGGTFRKTFKINQCQKEFIIRNFSKAPFYKSRYQPVSSSSRKRRTQQDLFVQVGSDVHFVLKGSLAGQRLLKPKLLFFRILKASEISCLRGKK